MEDILFASITEVRGLIERGEISPAELFSLTLGRIEDVDRDLNAFITVNRSPRIPENSNALHQPLHGIPISIKDLILTRDLPTTAGSRAFGEGIRSRRDALVVRRLKRSGAVIVGKTNLHEFAYGVTNENSHFGPVRNPWDKLRVSGGSSGGSAAAVAAGLSFASVGSDTRGSIRIPSAFCGITGLKPTLGLIPTQGVLPLSSTLDHVGPMTRSVEDAALLLPIMAGCKRDYLGESKQSANSLRIGVCEEYLRKLDSEVERRVSDAVEAISKSGMIVESVRMRHLQGAHQASRVIASVEALSYHRTLMNEKPEAYDPRVLQRLSAGARLTATEYVDALRVREAIRSEFRQLFRRIDCLVGATVPAAPPPIGQTFLEIGGNREEILENLVRMNAPQNVSGVPSLVVPCGFTGQDLPVGLQFIAGHHQEAKLLRLGVHFQRISDWHLRRPPET